MGATDRSYPGFRKPEVFDFTFLNQVLHRSRDVFDGHVRVHTMLIEQIDGIDLQSLKRALGDLLDVPWPTIQAQLLPLGTEFETELGGYHHVTAERSDRFAHKFFVRERAVRFGRVEECDATLDGRPNQCDHLPLVCTRTVAKAHSHAAEPERRTFPVPLSN